MNKLSTAYISWFLTVIIAVLIIFTAIRELNSLI